MKLGRILRILISLIILVIVIASVGADRLFDALRSINLGWFAIALLFHIIGLVVRTYRWSILIKALGAPVRFGRLLYLYLAGTFFNTFLPTGIGGDVVKIVELASDRGGAQAFSSVFADRLTGILGSSLIALVIAVLDPADVPGYVVTTVILISAGILIASFLLTRHGLFEWIIAHLKFWPKIPGSKKIQKVVEALTSYSIGTMVRAILVSLPFTMTLIATQYALALGLGIDAPLRYFALFVPMVALVQLLPLSFNGLGVREGTYQFLFGTVGIAGTQAVAMSLMYYIVRVIGGLFGGLLYLIGNLKADRKMTEERSSSAQSDH
jgi:glycosyltransferase 2 family protein